MKESLVRQMEVGQDTKTWSMNAVVWKAYVTDDQWRRSVGVSLLCVPCLIEGVEETRSDMRFRASYLITAVIILHEQQQC